MNEVVKQFLQDCVSWYSQGEFYKANASICMQVELALDEKIFPRYPIEITDELYDKVFFKAKELWPNDPFFALNSETAAGYGVDVNHKHITGSLTELKEGDLARWKINLQRYCLSEKLDGLSLSCYYIKQGNKIVLSQLVTRGNGVIGKDATRHAKALTSVPKTIDFGDAGIKFNNMAHQEVFTNDKVETIEVRGELICPKADIGKMIAELYETYHRVYKNGRNTITGFLGSKETNPVIAKYARFIAYDIYVNDSNEFDKSNQLANLKTLGFEIPEYELKFGNELNDAMLMDKVRDIKTNSKYECDGVVINMDTVPEQWKGFDTGTINPLSGRKFKIGATANEGVTKVTGVVWDVSKDGYLKPVIQVEPISLCGVTITNITGHNYKYIVDNNIAVGSTLQILRSGDVIPKHKNTISHLDNLDFCLPKIPTLLTETGTDLLVNFDKLAEVDENAWCDYTNEVNIKCLMAFCDELEIEESGEGTIRAIYSDLLRLVNKDNGFNIYIALYNLPKSVFESNIGVNGIKFYNNFHNRMKTITEVEWCSACSIFGRGFGKKKLQKVYDKFKTLEVKPIDLISMEGFAEKSGAAYVEHLKDYVDFMNYSKEAGIKFEAPKETEVLSNKFEGVVVAFTGCRDKELTDVINANGGTASDNFTKKTNILIVKDKSTTSSKMQKAQQQGCEIITLTEARHRFIG